MKKRIILYAHYDPDGIVDRHIIYQIDSFFKFGCEIIFISNSPIYNTDDILNICKEIIVRENKGFDFYAWKEVLLSKPRDYWHNWDELILMNSSCYGPIFSLDELFNEMDTKECDFWGITEYYKDTVYDTHLQSYFICFRNTLLKNNKFFEFFDSCELYNDVKSVIDNIECKLTHYFTNIGFTYKSYINIVDKNWNFELKYCQSLIYNNTPWLITKFRIPFVKVKSFASPEGFDSFYSSQGLIRALNKTKSNYPQKLIIDHQERTSPLSWKIQLPDSLIVIKENDNIKIGNNIKIGCIFHIHYKNTISDLINIILNFDIDFDLLISVTCENIKIDIIEAINSLNYKNIKNLYVRKVDNKGRDIVPWLSTFQDIHFNYDIILKMHIKNLFKIRHSLLIGGKIGLLMPYVDHPII